MKKIKLKIKTKIMLMNMAILIPTIVFIYIITINNLYSNVIKNSIDFLTKESYTTQLYISNYIEKYNEKNVEDNFLSKSSLINTYISNRLRFRTQIYNKNGEILEDSVMDSLSLYDEDINNAIKGNKAYIVKKIDGNIYILFSSPIYFKNNTLGCVRYVYCVDGGKKLIDNMFIIMGIIAIIAMLISWLLSNIFSNNIAGPIKKLKNISEKVAAGEYENRIDIKSGDEIEDLSKTFNKMSYNIKTYIESLKEERKKQKDFLDNVTHEFKTPLTAIIGYSELMPRLKEKEDIDDSLFYIKKEGTRLLKLVDELLYLSKLGKSEFIIDKTRSNLKKIVEESLTTMEPRLEKYNIEIVKNLFDITLVIDKDKTKQVILNVLDNAIKYSECKNITISMKIENSSIVLNITDDGIGIKNEDLEKLFEPIYRGYNLNNEDKGNGLGLSICKEIMKKQKGNIFISSEYKRNTCVKIIFNKSNFFIQEDIKNEKN
ncbi:HAMP domain-containing sensor histidine kinase [Clostridium oceanicum]|uniref:histidine kinase n=2 Tax=Clostridium oceanicum TaxID=1543 RepID=A0ABN1JHX6_9CLOT